MVVASGLPKKLIPLPQHNHCTYCLLDCVLKVLTHIIAVIHTLTHQAISKVTQISMKAQIFLQISLEMKLATSFAFFL